ncbi:MAG: hypothetical protein COT85_00630 [Chlamydiae bacterium CG10_big_fil_rev_8_21_14_0_10_42_34]|nr:MAG: hypothetical protein COT85_00630 [Chlamydiae bacterium CG10_big_fil_rev_8_21_14_0_10_42_34]
MKNWIFSLLFLPFILSGANHAITYEYYGRFGDALLSYLHAKWLSYQYQIPLLYKTFEYSSELKLHTREIWLEKDVKHNNRTPIVLQNEVLDLDRTDPTMFICPYFPEVEWELNQANWSYFQVEWKDPNFRNLAQKLIAPQSKIETIHPLENTINIAIHIREGGGFDSAGTRLTFPLKLPPFSFYTESLKEILSQFPNQRVYCHLFTDAKDPSQLADQLKAEIPSQYFVKFGYRKSNSHKKNVLEDFFSFFNFDILIRPESNFSIVPSLLHDFAIVRFPTDATVIGESVTINSVQTQTNYHVLQNLLKRVSRFHY